MRGGKLRGLVAIALAATLWATAALAAGPTQFLPVLCDEEGAAIGESLTAALETIGSRKSAPEHIVVLVHGFNVTRNYSDRTFDATAKLIRTAFGGYGKRIEVLGLQWPSGTGGDTAWLKKTVKKKLFGKGKDPYIEKADLAHAVGRQALRQLVKELNERFPDARVHVFAHSLGATVTLASMSRNLPVPSGGPTAPFFAPGAELAYDLVCLCGADADQNQRASRRADGVSAQMIWLTTSFVKTKQDKALVARNKSRGNRAAGNAAPLMTVGQLDELVSNLKIVFDTENIPAEHHFDAYYTRARVEDLVDAAVTIGNPKKVRSALLLALMKVLTAPDELEALTPFLDDPRATVVYYALWRLDRLVCGSSKHVADDTLRKTFSTWMHDRDSVERKRAESPCKLVQKGIFPKSAKATYPDEESEGDEETEQ